MIIDSDLKTLQGLRVLDWDIDRLRERAVVIPRELDRLAKELRVHQDIMDEEGRKLNDLRLDRRAAEKEIESARTKRRDFEASQYKIRNNTEYQANMREIENMKVRIAEYEEKVLQVLMQEEEILKEIDRLQKLVDEERRKHDLAAGSLKTEQAQVDGELAGLDASRNALVERLSGPLRSRYERIRRSKGDLAIVGVEAGACGGCGYQMPPQRVQEVRRNRDLILCEGCGRILVAIDE
jgi:predicted  nucleic acid-binding Zn-ribbon protein